MDQKDTTKKEVGDLEPKKDAKGGTSADASLNRPGRGLDAGNKSLNAGKQNLNAGGQNLDAGNRGAN
ncbi:MAG: hypothetical protein ACR2NX_06885 [Chthoniobacterales bacterium]